MTIKWIKKIICAIILTFFMALNCQAAGTKDGIPIDDNIEISDNVKKPGINIKYIIRKAKSRGNAAQREAKENMNNNGVISGPGADTGNNGLILGPGADLEQLTLIFEGGDITSLSQNGANTIGGVILSPGASLGEATIIFEGEDIISISE